MNDVAQLQALFDQALALQRQRRWLEAVAAYREVAQVQLTVNVAVNMSICLVELGLFDVAEHWGRIVAVHRADQPRERLRLGHIYRANRKMDLAELEYRTALALSPADAEAKVALAQLLLQLGRYLEAWPLLEARAELAPDKVPEMRASFPQWRGEPLDGKSILVVHEQGFGDQIQMARFVAPMKAAGARAVTLICRPQLAALFAAAPGVDAVVAAELNQPAPVQPHDYWTRYVSLPGLFGATLDNLPQPPYLAAPPERRDRWAGFQGKVGFAWQASATGVNAAAKALSPQDAEVLRNLGCVSLQPEETGAADFADTAAIVEQLDLVISIDTAVAHLAGALGKPCWTLLPRLNTDWRWLLDRSDSPWYPSLRLYRQEKPGDWSEVLAQVSQDLAAFRAAKA